MAVSMKIGFWFGTMYIAIFISDDVSNHFCVIQSIFKLFRAGVAYGFKQVLIMNKVIPYFLDIDDNHIIHIIGVFWLIHYILDKMVLDFNTFLFKPPIFKIKMSRLVFCLVQPHDTTVFFKNNVAHVSLWPL